MKEYLKNYAFIIFRFLAIFYLINSDRNIGYIYYEKTIIFISFELIGIFIFHTIKNINSLKKIILSFFLMYFIVIVIFYYIEIKDLIFLVAFLILIFIPLILYSFILFLIKRNLFYFLYTGVQLIWFIVFLLLNIIEVDVKKSNFKIDKLEIFIIYGLISFLYITLIKKLICKKE